MAVESILTIIFSALVAISTVVYAILTWRLVNETIQLRKAQTEPKISIRIEPSENCMFYCDMIIENIGLGPAYDINFQLDTDITDYHKKPLSDMNMIKNGIQYLAPCTRRQFLFTKFTDETKETAKFHDSFLIKVIYKNCQNETIEEGFTIDFSEFIDITKLGESPMYSIAKSLEKIEKKIPSLRP